MSRSRTGGHRLPRLSFALHLLLWLGFALLVAAAAAVGLWLLSGRPVVSGGVLDPRDRLELAKVALTTTAGVGGVIALVVAYRKQQFGENEHQRENTKLFNERYAKACEQLGSGSLAVRFGGIYAMAGLADDWEAGRQMCIDVFCAYLRMPYTPPAGTDTEPSPETSSYEIWAARREAALVEQQVRHTIVRTITQRFRDNATVPWQGSTLDFTGAVFDGGDFSRALFIGGGRVSFDRAVFCGPVDFAGATFGDCEVNFDDATFNAGEVRFDGAVFCGAGTTFEKIRVKGAHLHFNGAQFTKGEVLFTWAILTEGEIHFNAARLDGGRVVFSEAEFHGGKIFFNRSEISQSGLSFTGTMFSGSNVGFLKTSVRRGTVDFTDAEFSGGVVHFGGAEFTGGEICFDNATFSGSRVHFCCLVSGGKATFRHAEFTGGGVQFAVAGLLDGEIDLSDAKFGGGQVSFCTPALFEGTPRVWHGFRFSEIVDLSDPPSGLVVHGLDTRCMMCEGQPMTLH